MEKDEEEFTNEQFLAYMKAVSDELEERKKQYKLNKKHKLHCKNKVAPTVHPLSLRKQE
jgi:hypothetical protein